MGRRGFETLAFGGFLSGLVIRDPWAPHKLTMVNLYETMEQ